MGQGAGSKTDTAVKLVLIFFISLLSFSVGTFVGKQVSDADHRRASLEIDGDADRGVASTDEQAEPDVAAISDEEVASLTKEFMDAERSTASEEPPVENAADAPADEASVDPHAGYDHMAGDGKAEPLPETAPKPEPAPAKTAKAPAAPAAKPTADEVKAAAERVSKALAPAKDPVENRKPTAALPVAVAASSVGKYTVQIGSYSTEDEARAFAEKMKGKGYSAFYVPADIKGQTWYRVSVGLYPNAKGAEEYRQTLIKDNVVKAAIVSKIVK